MVLYFPTVHADENFRGVFKGMAVIFRGARVSTLVKCQRCAQNVKGLHNAHLEKQDAANEIMFS